MSVFFYDLPGGITPSGGVYYDQLPLPTFPLSELGNYSALYALRHIAPSGSLSGYAPIGSTSTFPLGVGYSLSAGEREDLGGGFIAVTTPFIVPQTGSANAWYDWEQTVYTFPGYYPGRSPQPTMIYSRVANELYLAADPNTVPIQAAQSYLLSGYATAYLSDLTTGVNGRAATVPSLTNYTAWAAASTGVWLNAESSWLEHYRGQLWIRKTRQVKAQ